MSQSPPFVFELVTTHRNSVGYIFNLVFQPVSKGGVKILFFHFADCVAGGVRSKVALDSARITGAGRQLLALFDIISYAIPANTLLGTEGKPYKHHRSMKVSTRHKTPKSTIVAVVPVIAH